MEDGWVLGRAISEYSSSSSRSSSHFHSLSSTAQLYQDVRLPRAQRVQTTSRAAGNTYELQAEGMLDKTFDECAQIMADRTRERMKWVWEEDLDVAYDNVCGDGVTVGEGASNGTR